MVKQFASRAEAEAFLKKNKGYHIATEEEGAKASKPRGLLGNIIGGITDPIGRLFTAGGEGAGVLNKLLANQSVRGYKPEVMDVAEFEQAKQDPFRFATQRAGDLGSLGLMFMPGIGATGSVGKAALQGAAIGGLSSIGGAGQDEDLLSAGLGGAALGGVTGGALQGLGSFISKKGTSALGAKITKGGKEFKYGDIKPPINSRFPSWKNAKLRDSNFDELLGHVETITGKPISNGKQFLNQAAEAQSTVGKSIDDAFMGLESQIDGNKLLKDIYDAAPTIQYGRKAQELLGDVVQKVTGKGTLGISPATSLQSIRLDGNDLQQINNAIRDLYVQQPKEALDPIVKALYEGFKTTKTRELAGAGYADLARQYSLLADYAKSSPRIESAMQKLSIPFLTGPGVITGAVRNTEGALRNVVGTGMEKAGGLLQGGALPGLGGFLQQPALQRSLEFLPGQMEEAPMEQPMGIESAIGTQETSSMSQEQRSQLFIQLIGQGHSPNEAKTIVEMLMPGEESLNESQQKRKNVADSAQLALQTLQSTKGVAGKLPKIGKTVSDFLGTTSPEMTGYARNIAAVNTAIQNMLSGTSLTANEKKSLRDLQIHPTDEPKIALVKLQGLITQYGQ